MGENEELMRAAIEQACFDSKSLHGVWCSEDAGNHHFNKTHLIDTQRIVHRISGSSLTFGIDSVASIARVCEHVLRETIVQHIDPASMVTATHQHKISGLILNLYDSCLQARGQFFSDGALNNLQNATNDDLIGSCSSNGIHVLVVDDDPVMRIFLQRKLEKRGFKISLADDGEKAYEKAIKLKPNLILLDGLMPGMSGFDVLNKIRDNSDIAHIPVFMLTALSDQENVADGLLSGADDYIIKPFDVDDIVQKIKIACA